VFTHVIFYYYVPIGSRASQPHFPLFPLPENTLSFFSCILFRHGSRDIHVPLNIGPTDRSARNFQKNACCWVVCLGGQALGLRSSGSLWPDPPSTDAYELPNPTTCGLEMRPVYTPAGQTGRKFHFFETAHGTWNLEVVQGSDRRVFLLLYVYALLYFARAVA